jgi:uncharacterized protein (TIGR02246 family)
MPYIAAIQELYDEYVSIITSRDMDELMSLWEEDGIRSEPGLPPIVGTENIQARFEELLSGPFNHKVIPLGEPLIEVSGDIAYSYRIVTMASTPIDGGEAVHQDLKVLTIFRKQPDNTWLTYIDHLNFHPTWSMDTIPSELTEENPYY